VILDFVWWIVLGATLEEWKWYGALEERSTLSIIAWNSGWHSIEPEKSIFQNFELRIITSILAEQSY